MICLSGNGLKLIAAASMFLDHMGLMLFPGNLIWRILGRLALPIYAYMIAEGCRYTRNKKNYFATVFGLAVVCQTVYFFFAGDTYLSILFTFSLAILTIYALQRYQTNPTAGNALVFALAVMGVYVLNVVCTIDYGFWGCMLPVFPALVRNTPRDSKGASIAMLGLGLVLLALEFGGVQWFGLAALPVLLLYNGQRGKWKMKYFFYIFYPVHLAALEALVLLTH